MFGRMLAALSSQNIQPVVDRVFAFADAPAALKHLESGAHFGKIVIDVGQ
jgi:NADPH:quinone reductase-like Zn-dependent oxidoreductase